MKLSVIVITRNESARLRLALTSYRAQRGMSPRDFELVVVDDASGDETPDVIEEHAGLLPLTAVRNDTALGISAARNRGVEASCGDVLLFMDGDVLAEPTLLAAHLWAHRRSGEAILTRGENRHLRCTRFLRDPELGLPRPGKEERIRRSGSLAASLVTRAQILGSFPDIERRSEAGIYPGGANRRLSAHEVEALIAIPDSPILWMAIPGHNVSMPSAAFEEVGGYDADQQPIEQREIALRLQSVGLRPTLTACARSYHLTHLDGGRDPLQNDANWQERFFAKHDGPFGPLLLLYWKSLVDRASVPREARIDSLIHLDRILHSGEMTAHLQAAQTLIDHARQPAVPDVAPATVTVDGFPAVTQGAPSRATKQPKRCLYFSPVGRDGKEFLAATIARFGHDDFDWLIVSYDGTAFPERIFAHCEVVHDSGSISHLARVHLTPRRCQLYEYVFCWSDDLDIGAFSYRNFLDIMQRNGLEIAQPALTPQSAYSHGVTVQSLCGIGRLTDFVEFMAQVCTRQAWNSYWAMLKRLEWHDNPWGWGYDRLAKSICGYRGMGIVDCEPITHTRLKSPADLRAWTAMARLLAACPEHRPSDQRVLGQLT